MKTLGLYHVKISNKSDSSISQYDQNNQFWVPLKPPITLEWNMFGDSHIASFEANEILNKLLNFHDF